jgi:two-component system LytT family sensor kinase
MKFKNIEITIATILLLLAIYSLFGFLNVYVDGRYSAEAYGMSRFKEKGLSFNFYLNYLLPFLINYLTIYAAFIWVACSLPDKYITQQKWQQALISVVAGIVAMCMLFVLKDCLSRPYEDNILFNSIHRELGVATGMTAMMLAYEAFKQVILWMIDKKQVASEWKKNPLYRDLIWCVLIWGIGMFGVLIFKPYRGFALLFALIVPCVFAIYLTCLYWLIPKFYKQAESKTLWLLATLVTLGINVPLNGLYSVGAAYNGASFLVLFLFIWLLQLAIIVPVCIYLYEIKNRRVAELKTLKTELGNSNAGLQFLRSQINPHFLFNALHTLYGTALMESAEKTSEGIQKLGDMMRFMLHENNQDKIALSREINYLHNYIDLQNLRIASSPEIIIDVQIADIIGYDEIAPMLLIPFIENAYKHGISFKEKSWINVSLFKKDSVLHLDVHNSIHPENENDPERFHSGTGLDNVKQRLQWLYPEAHELVIQQNPREFFIHLSLTLSTQKITTP